jgi:hypothetical protein
MSFLERIIFRFTHDPSADATWKKIQEDNKVACEAEIERWNSKLATVNGVAFTKATLPEDVTYLVEFIKERIKKLKTYKLSSTDIDALNINNDTQNFNIAMSVAPARYSFKVRCTDAITQFNKMIKELKDKKQTVPPSYPKLVKRIEKELPWFAKQKFVEADVYDKEFKLLAEDAGVIMNGTGGSIHDPDMSKKAAMDAHDEARNEFSILRLLGNVLGTTMTILMVFLLVVFGVYGSSLATNLNLYHAAPYRVLYAIYGFIFFFVVIPYVLLYRWWWNGKKPRFYSLIPLVPYHFDNYYTGLALSWMSYKPDDQVESLKEWLLEQKSQS